MGTWVTRTRAWCYTAFYDEYVGRHINTTFCGSVIFLIPMYMYGIKFSSEWCTNRSIFVYHCTNCAALVHYLRVVSGFTVRWRPLPWCHFNSIIMIDIDSIRDFPGEVTACITAEFCSLAVKWMRHKDWSWWRLLFTPILWH